jgi:cyclic pyranopterin phosphate synthase
MVDVGAKPDQSRRAVAVGRLTCSPKTIEMLRAQALPKGDVLTVARVAAIQAAKRTDELIPLCHQLPLTQVDPQIAVDPNEGTVTIVVETRTTDRTGVEMEAMVASSVGALTIYDMVKGIEPGVVVERVELLDKTGGKADFHRA